MNKITTIEIAGKEYPLCFTGGALRKVCQRYGSFQTFAEIIETEGEDLSGDSLDAVFYTMALMMEGAARRIRLIEGKDVEILTKEEIEDSIDFSEVGVIVKGFSDAFAASSETEIKTAEEDPNEMAAQGN